VSATGLYTYPDASVVCGELQLDEQDPYTILNPTLLAEVLSESTETYDRSKKFDHYRKIPSLKEYLLVSQDRPRVERLTKDANGTWISTIVEGIEQTLELPSLGITIRLAEVFERVEFD